MVGGMTTGEEQHQQEDRKAREDTAPAGPNPGSERRRAFAEELGQFFEERGLPRMEGRMLGWLIVCDPPEQSAEDLAAALGASRGGISMSVRMLQRAGALERVAVPGSRKHYYRLRPGMWRQEIDKRVEEAAMVRDLTAKGLQELSDAPPEQLRRLRDMNDMYSFLSQEYSRIRDLWHSKEDGNGEPSGPR
ncbi:hypothetical protein GCM10027570_46530 [Streptomonospora sediminis]